MTRAAYPPGTLRALIATFSEWHRRCSFRLADQVKVACNCPGSGAPRATITGS